MSKAKRPKSKNIDKAKKAVSDNSKVTGGASRCPVWRFQREVVRRDFNRWRKGGNQNAARRNQQGPWFGDVGQEV